MSDQTARIGYEITADASQAIGAEPQRAPAQKGTAAASDASAAASARELEVLDAKTLVLGTAAGEYDAATLASLGFKVAEEEEAVATVGVAVAERALSGSRTALVR